MPTSFLDQADTLHAVTLAARQKMANNCSSSSSPATARAPERQHLPSASSPSSSPSSTSSKAVNLRSLQSLENLLRQALSLASRLHLQAARSPSLKRSKEYQLAEREVAWWLDEQAQAAIAHVRKAPPCARAEMDHALQLCLPGSVHLSVYERLKRECAAPAVY